MIKKLCLAFFVFCILSSPFKAHNAPVIKTAFDNGFTVLIYPTNTLQDVSILLCVGVGSKHEQDHEKGLAHLLEHMLFKGTNILSETDVDFLCHKLSGWNNAATSYDCTQFFMNLPIQHALEAIPVLASMFNNATLKDDLINSEMKVIIQELKIGKDNYVRSLFEKMFNIMLYDHPYRDPIIGYKQHLWNMNHDTVMQFYKKHYIPNNAFLVVVGNVNPAEAIESAKIHFGNLKPHFEYTQPIRFHNQDLSSSSVTIYRDIKQPVVTLNFAIPGFTELEPTYLPQILAYILAHGKDSVLYKTLVDELNWVYKINAYCQPQYDHGVFTISFEPKDTIPLNQIVTKMVEKIEELKKSGLPEDKINEALFYFESNTYESYENNFSRALHISFSYLAKKDENYCFNLNFKESAQVKQQIESLLDEYIRPSLMHTGYIMPIQEEDKEYWKQLQETSDQEDARILAQRIRTTDTEPGNYVNTVFPKDICDIELPIPEELTLENGLFVNYYHNSSIPMISIMLDFDNYIEYEPQELLGISDILMGLLADSGTKNYPGVKFIKEFQKYGISFNWKPNKLKISVRSIYFEKALELIQELLTQYTFQEKELEKIKDWRRADIKHFWDNEVKILNHLIDQHIYKNHPYGINHIGTEETINAITIDKLYTYMEEHYSPDKSRFFIVGDIGNYNVADLVNTYLGSWSGPKLIDRKYPKLMHIEEPATITYELDRDQIYLAYAGLSINRYHEDYLKLVLANTALHKYLFRLRERSGAFYSIHGNCLVSAEHEPGQIVIKTICSRERVKEVEQLLANAITKFTDHFTQEDLDAAKRSVAQEPANYYSTNNALAFTFSLLKEFNLPYDYYVRRIQEIKDITLDEVRDAIKKVFDIKHMTLFKVGRLKD